MLKKYAFLCATLLIVSSWFLGLQAQDTAKNSLWSYVGLERDFSDYREDRLEYDVEDLIYMMRGGLCYTDLTQERLEELLASKDLSDIIQRVLREESKDSARALVKSAGLGLATLVTLILSYKSFLEGTKTAGWKSAFYGAASVPLLMVSLLTGISLWVREVVKKGHIFRRGSIPSQEEVVGYIHALIAEEKNLESEEFELHDKEEL